MEIYVIGGVMVGILVLHQILVHLVLQLFGFQFKRLTLAAQTFDLYESFGKEYNLTLFFMLLVQTKALHPTIFTLFVTVLGTHFEKYFSTF